MSVLKLVYFAWVRERIGKAEEEVMLPGGVATVGDLLTWLAGRGAGGSRLGGAQGPGAAALVQVRPLYLRFYFTTIKIQNKQQKGLLMPVQPMVALLKLFWKPQMIR